jgi:TrmH family RNA methyltransferase
MRKGQFGSENQLPVEGLKLVWEALQSRLVVEEVYVCVSQAEEKSLQEILRRLHDLKVSVQFVADRVYNNLVETESSQGIIALVKLPRFQLSRVLRDSPLLLLAHQLQDPGNLGTLIRSSEAFGVAAVLLTGHTVSAANQKAVRASAGSLLRVPVLSELNVDRFLDELRHDGFRLVAAIPRGGVDFREADYRESTALVVGNEGSGLPPNTLDRIDLRVTVSVATPVESLNVAVASSIILAEAARQRQRGSQGSL